MDDLDKIQEDFNFLCQENIQKLQEEIQSGEVSSSIYYEMFLQYKLLSCKKEYMSELKKYSNLAISAAKEEISLNKNPATAYSVLSEIYEYKKDLQNALTFINKSINLEPDNIEFYLIRAQLYAKMKEFSKSRQDYDKVVELCPEMLEKVRSLESTDRLLYNSDFNSNWVTILIVVALVCSLTEFRDILLAIFETIFR